MRHCRWVIVSVVFCALSGTASAQTTPVPIQNADVNGDGLVAMTDVSIVQANLGRRCGQPALDPRADVNRDCVVNVTDVAFVSRNLGARFPPTIAVTVAPAANVAGWHKSDVAVSFACTGAQSCPSSVTVATDGADQTIDRTVSNAGGSATAHVVLNIDKTQPVVTAAASPAANANGWNNGPVVITFAASDALSGVVTGSLSGPVTLSGDGANQSAIGAATDRAGNVGSVSRTGVNIDTTRPTISVVLSPEPNASGHYDTAVTAHFLCSDNGSGVATCPPDHVVATAGADLTVSGTAVDRAGNEASVTSAPFTIDLVPLTISVVLTPLPNANGWNNTPVTAHFACNGGSGVAQCPADQIISTEGAAQTVTGVVTDAAGHSATASATVSIDRTPPVVTLSQPTNGTTGTTVFTPSVALTGTATDGGSGIASATCNGLPATVSGGALSCTASLVPGANAVEAIATDRAGNSASTSQTFTYVRVPIITITSPSNLSYTNITPTTVSGTVDDATATVTINSIQATVVNGSFSLALPLAEGPNILTATAATAAGSAGTASLTVTLDTTPPHVSVTSPPDQFETTESSLFVSGIINDIVVGTVNAEQAGVTVNGVPAQVANRTFLANNVALALGPNVIQVVGRDRVGNQATTQITVKRLAVTAQPRIQLVSGTGQSGVIGSLLSVPLTVSLVDGSGNPVPNKPVIFKVTQNDGMIASGGIPAPTVIATTDAQGRAQALWTLGGRAGAGGNTVEAYSVGFEGTAIFTATGNHGVAGKIVVDTGNNQIGPIGQRLPKPFIAVVVDSGNNRLGGVPVTFTVSEGGGDIDGQPTLTVTSDPDGRVAATLTMGTQEGEANNLVSATFPSNQGSAAAFTASGRAPGDPVKTTISGVVLDNSNAPIPGVTVRAVLTNVMHSNANATQTAQSAQTDAQGQFSIAQAPVGFVKLIVDGSTAQLPGSYPSLEYDMVTVAGQPNTVGQPIFLLELNTANKLCVTDATGGGTLTIPEAPGFSLTFGPGQVTFPGGSKTGCVTVSVVHGDKVPMAPGFGQQPRFIVTIQPAGAIFNPPAPITLPNVDGLRPREVTEMYSFDHDISSFVAIGTGTVTDDGLVIRSNPGVGVLKAGWHCGGNPNTPGTVAQCAICFFCPGSLSNCMPQGNGVACGNGGTCQFGRGCVGGGGSCPPGYTFNAAGTQCCQGGTCIQPTCPPGQVFDPVTRLCVNSGPCAPGYTLDPTGTQCCQNGVCVPAQCPAGRVLDPATGLCQPFVNTCTPQTAGQLCNAGGGSASPGTCDASGGCAGSNPSQCGQSSGCSACITTAGSGQQCTQCSNGQPPVNGQCQNTQATVQIDVNNTSTTSDDITVLNPPQPMVIGVTLHTSSTQPVQVQLSVLPAGTASLSQSSFNLTDGASAIATLMPLLRSQSANDVLLVATVNGTNVGVARLTIVNIVVPHIRHTDTPAAMTQDRIPPRVPTPITVTIQPDLTSSGQVVTLAAVCTPAAAVAGLCSSSANGTVDIDGPLSLYKTTDVVLQGRDQTAPGFAGNLSLGILVRGQIAAQSSGFSVAAIPIGIREAFSSVVAGTLVNPFSSSDLFFSIIGESLCLANLDLVRWWGLSVAITPTSDSGVTTDLDQVELLEQVEPLPTNYQKFSLPILNPPVGTLFDKHARGICGSSPPSLGTSTTSQLHVFYDKRTDPEKSQGYFIEHSGYVIEMKLRRDSSDQLLLDVSKIGTSIVSGTGTTIGPGEPSNAAIATTLPIVIR